MDVVFYRAVNLKHYSTIRTRNMMCPDGVITPPCSIEFFIAHWTKTFICGLYCHAQRLHLLFGETLFQRLEIFSLSRLTHRSLCLYHLPITEYNPHRLLYRLFKPLLTCFTAVNIRVEPPQPAHMFNKALSFIRDLCQIFPWVRFFEPAYPVQLFPDRRPIPKHQKFMP